MRRDSINAGAAFSSEGFFENLHPRQRQIQKAFLLAARLEDDSALQFAKSTRRNNTTNLVSTIDVQG